MATITSDMRMSTYRKAPEHIQEMYGSPETGRLLRHLREEYRIQDDDAFVNLIGDIMLGFYSKSDLRKLLQGLVGVSEEAAIAIEKDLSALLFKIDGVPVVPVAPKTTREELELRPAGAPPRVPPPPPPIPPPTGGDRPLTREEVLRAITPKRTMATDIESVRKEQEGKQAPFTDMR